MILVAQSTCFLLAHQIEDVIRLTWGHHHVMLDPGIHQLLGAFFENKKVEFKGEQEIQSSI